MHRLNSHARFARRTAEALGFSFKSLDGADAYLFEISDGARRACFACGAASPYALNDARGYALARDKSFCAQTLQAAGLPVVPWRLFFATARHAPFRSPGREPADALAFAQQTDYPIFCKPNAAARGELAEIVADFPTFQDYLHRVAKSHDAFLAQPFVQGAEHRVVALRGEALFSYRKTAPSLVGDGASSIAALFAALNAKPSIAAPSPLSAFQFIDADGRARDAAEVLALNESVRVAGRANRSAGGDAQDIAAPPPRPLASLAEAGAAALGLGLVAFDVFDVSPKEDLSALQIIEANASPALETLEANGRFDLIETIWAANFEAAFAR